MTERKWFFRKRSYERNKIFIFFLIRYIINITKLENILPLNICSSFIF